MGIDCDQILFQRKEKVVIPEHKERLFIDCTL